MITLRAIDKSYRQHKVLQDICLQIPESSIFALLGPNGSGKTTILKSILGLVLPAESGDIQFQNRSILGTTAYKKHIGYMPQSPKFPPHLKVRELISLLQKLRQQAGPHQERLMRDLQIAPFWNKACGELSGGMLQKVNVLQCFMFENRLLILDEPTLGLDPQITFYLKGLMREQKTKEKTILFTSHVMAEVEELADQMALLVEGKIYTVLSPAELKRRENKNSLEAALYQFWNEVAKK